MSVSSKEEINDLRSAIRFASTTLRNLAISPVSSPNSTILPPDYESKIPAMDIQFPPDILTPIINLRIPNNFKTFLLKKMESLCNQLQKKHTESYKRSCKTLLGYQSIGGDLLQPLREVYEARFQRLFVPVILKQVSSVTNRLKDVGCHLKHVAKRPFNNDFIPFLETYFQYNGYPSIAHRLIIAKHSGMTPRQIEVWFQNHRSRAKKEGKTIQRLLSDFPLRRAFEALSQTYEQDGVFVVASSEKSKFRIEMVDDDIQPLETDSNVVTSNIEANPLENAPLRPLHAFPCIFDRTRLYPNLGTSDVYKFPPPIWLRRPVVVSTRSETVIDMDEFVSIFQVKLSFLDKKRGVSPSILSDTPTWFSSTVTVPPRGRHPAVICKQVTSIDARFKESHPIQIPLQLPVGPIIPGPVSQINALSKPLHLNHRRSTTAFERYAPSSITKSVSRACSSASDASSTSRISYLASSHSSPELSTPPQLPDTGIFYSPEEFFLDDYDFGIFSFRNHPDFGQDKSDDFNQYEPLAENRQSMATVDPSFLMSPTLSYTSSNHPQGYS